MGFKWEAYRQYDSLRHYLVVHHRDHAVIVHHRRDADNAVQLWIGQGTIELPAIGVSLTLDEIFEGVPPPPPRKRRQVRKEG